MSAPKPRPGIMDIVAYKPGVATAKAAKIYKLSSNESALGPSPKAMEAFASEAAGLYLYPDPSASRLRAALGEALSINKDLIVCGAGSDEILQLICRGYLGPEDSLVMSKHGFSVYAIAAKACGAEVIYAEEENLTTSVDNLLAAVKPNTRIMMVANPNNPTGTVISGAELRRLRAGLREDILLLIDSAYAEFVEWDEYEDGIAMVDEAIASGTNNVFTTRTFSKLYGLGGLRIGWGYGPAPVMDVLNRIRGPFNVSSPAQGAAIAALADDTFRKTHIAHNKAEQKKLMNEFSVMGLMPTPSHCNFILVQMSGDTIEGRTKMAEALHAHLMAHGVIVRQVKEYFLPDYLRISIGSCEANQALLAAMHSFKG